MNIKYKKCIYFILSCIVIFCYTYFYSSLFLDEIWNYGFAYNISNGLVPYRDFNMIITPFYSFILSAFIIAFGHHLWSMHILNAIMITIMLFVIYSKIGKKILLYIPVLLLYSYPGYNLCSLFLIIILISICEDEFQNKEFLIGILCGILFLTKQTIGICMFIPLMYYSKNKLKSFIGYIVPILCLIIYLIYNNSFFQFIDYCFLGMLDFSNDNSLYLFLPIEFIICFCLIYRLVKSRLKEQKLFYILMFQVISIPIMDDYHFMIAFLSVYYYLLEIIQIKRKYRIKYYFIIILFSTVYWNYLANDYDDIHLYSDKSSYLYGRYVEKYIQDNVQSISNYLENIKDNWDNIYLITQNSYMIKLNTSYMINKFDLINKGNMGYHGEDKYIQELEDICSNSSCAFLIYRYEINKDDPNSNQTSIKIIEYIYKNYLNTDLIDDFEIYTN